MAGLTVHTTCSLNLVDQEDETEEDGVPYESLRPTYTHEALNKLMTDGYVKYIISQNGDGLHGLSGIPSDKISELHGNVFLEVCEKCKREYYRPYYVMDDTGSLYFEELEDYGKTDIVKPKYAVKCKMCRLSHRTGRKCETKVNLLTIRALSKICFSVFINPEQKIDFFWGGGRGNLINCYLKAYRL